ncbi:MAG: hypothetical protein ACKVRP_10465 [Bacteroidota bacterium]
MRKFLYLLPILFHALIAAAEYTAKGKIIAEANFYDEKYNLLAESPYPDAPMVTTSDFVYMRKNEAWRLNLTHPDRGFPPGSVHRSVMPFSEDELVDIISYPIKEPAEGNAAVTIQSNKFLTADSWGAHFAWTLFNFDEIKRMIGPKLECHAFWKVGMPVDTSVRTHRLIEANSSIQFWNRGKYPQVDAENKTVFENGEPLMRPYPAPFDQGFSEAECSVEWKALGGNQRIPNRAQIVFSTPVRKSAESEPIMIPLLKITLVTESLNTGEIDERVFKAEWTNTVASVVDHRVKAQLGTTLSYLTKTNRINPSSEALQKRVKTFNAMRNLKEQTPSATVNIAGAVILATLAILPVIMWMRRR